jgi:outer membrane protein assembly complex protein YaeT
VAPDEITVRSDAGALRLNGGADLAGRTLDLTASGRLELRALAPFLTDTSLSGVAEMDLAVKGALDDPNVEGGLSFRDASLRLREIPQALTSLQGALVFDARTLRLQDVTGLFGGGSLTMSGSAGLKGGSLEDVRVELKGRDVALRYPEGLRSRLDADLSLTGSWGTLLLSGAVRAQRSLYDLDVAFAETLRTPALKPAPSPTLRQVALDVRVETQNPVLVRNNLGSLQASGSLTARGNMETVEPFGRLEILPGGKVRMQNREFVVSSGSLSYNGSWDPQISLTARTVIRDVRDQENRALGSYSVTVVARGSLDRPELSFSSDPSRPEGEVVGLIVTGRLGSDPMRSAGRMAGEQAALLLAAPLTRGVSRGLRELGFDDVSIQPELLAGETEPGARFTFGKNLTRHVGLVYSLSLKSPEDRFVQLEAHPGRDVALTVQRREDGTVTYGAGQRLRWGGARRARDTSVDERVRLREVEIEGELPETMRSVLKSRPGKKASAWDVQEDADRLRERLIEQGYLEAEVGARIDEDAAVFQARAGPKYTWRVEGMTQPPDLAPTMKEALYEEDAFERGQERLLEELRRRGHLRARIEASAEGDAGARTLVFRVEPGPRIETVDVSFPGATAVSRAELLKAAGGSAAIVASPEESLKRIEAEYRERHYLSARVGPARMTESDRSVRVEVPVQEGTQARVASVAFRGVSLPEDELRSVAGIQTGALYDETRVTESQARIRSHYFERGYPSVRVTSEVVPSGGDVDVVFRLAEGERVVVGRIVLSGLRRTRESLVRRHIPLEVGDPLDPRKLASVERRLLELGVFGRAMASVSGNPATVQVDVEEDARLLSGYDLRYNDEEGASALVDAETRNVFGTGLSVGGRYRVGRDVREGRGTLHFPVPFGPTGDVTASVFRLEEDLPGGEPGTLNERIQDGLQIQHTLPFESRWSLLYGYRFKRVTLTSFEPITIAAVDASLLRDTRDNVLDARSGRFLSFNLQLSPKSVGSDFDFVKGFAQAFLARSLRPSLTWAQGYRLGVAHVLGGEPMPSFERFKAGGGNSLRGFATDAVGPRSFLGDPAGGQAVLILNQELRYHHGSGLGGVVFYDAGNVFSRVRDFGVDLRHAVGFGLRWDSPVGLLRGDVGFPLGRKPGERSYRLFFSLGQAF